MGESAVVGDGYFNGTNHRYFSSSSSTAGSQRHVSYSKETDKCILSDKSNCGTCGYELNLSSSNRNTSTIGSKYGKSIKRGLISFVYIDDSRFTLADEFQCMPYFSKNSWGFFRWRTKLLCRKCGNHIGTVYKDTTSNYPLVSNVSDSSPGKDVSSCRQYDVKIRALQPSSAQSSGIPLYL